MDTHKDEKHEGVKKNQIVKAKLQINSKSAFLNNIINRKQLELNEKRMMSAVTTNNYEKVEELLQSKISPNICDNLLRTPLHLAASRNYIEIVSLLLKYGADPNQRDIVGNTALHLAACSNNLQVITLLLDAGTDVGSLDKYGRNPLQLAESKLRLLQGKHREGFIEITQLRLQLQQIIDLMYSFLRRQNNNQIDELDMLKLSLNDSPEGQLDNQMSLLLSAIHNIKI